MNLALKIAFRSLASRRSRYAHSAIAWIALLGLILGVAAQVVAVSILAGFEQHFTQSILGFNAHLVLLREGEINETAFVLGKLKNYESTSALQAITPFLYREGLIAHRSKVKGIAIKGIEPITFSKVYDLQIRLFKGKADENNNIQKALEEVGEMPSLLLGTDLAETLEIKPDDNIVSILSPHGDLKKISDVNQFKKFRVVGTFSSGMYEYDSQFAFLNLKSAQDFFEAPQVVTGFEMKVADLTKASPLAEEMAKDFSFPYQALSWDELNAEIFRALKLEKKLFFIIMGLIVLVAAANLIGLIVILVSAQSKEISILKAMGMKNKTLQRIFTLQGLLLALVGILSGACLGIFSSYFLAHHYLIPLAKEIYLISALPISFSWKMMAWVMGFGGGVSYLATSIASRRIIHLDLDL